VRKTAKVGGSANALKRNKLLAVEAVMGELVSVRLFPVSRENTGKFVDFSLKKTIIHRVRSGNSMAYRPISLSVKTGKVFGLSGNEK
jgi:hypothetical protein